MMAKQPPLEGGVEPESRDRGEVEAMDVELALSTRSMPSGEEEGEVHSNGGWHPEAVLQGLFSLNAAVESDAGCNQQARWEAVAPVHTVPP